MEMLDPGDGLEYVFMGDSSGNIYRMEGTGSSGDGGINDISVSWTSKVFSAPMDAEAFDVEGYVKYKKNEAATVKITLLAAGKAAFDSAITVPIPAIDANYWGESIYFGGDIYWGVPFKNRLIRYPLRGFTGQMSDFQIKVDVTGTTSFNINEIGLRMTVASQ